MVILSARVQRIFHLFILSATSEKSFISYKDSAAVQALINVCPVRPRVLSVRRFVQFDPESYPAGEYLHSERLWMLEKVSAVLNTSPTTIPQTPPEKKKLGNNFFREAEGCR